MNSEENTIRLIGMLDKAIEEIDKIDERLQIYEDKLLVNDFCLEFNFNFDL